MSETEEIIDKIDTGKTNFEDVHYLSGGRLKICYGGRCSIRTIEDWVDLSFPGEQLNQPDGGD